MAEEIKRRYTNMIYGPQPENVRPIGKMPPRRDEVEGGKKAVIRAEAPAVDQQNEPNVPRPAGVARSIKERERPSFNDDAVPSLAPARPYVQNIAVDTRPFYLEKGQNDWDLSPDRFNRLQKVRTDFADSKTKAKEHDANAKKLGIEKTGALTSKNEYGESVEIGNEYTPEDTEILDKYADMSRKEKKQFKKDWPTIKAENAEKAATKAKAAQAAAKEAEAEVAAKYEAFEEAKVQGSEYDTVADELGLEPTSKKIIMDPEGTAVLIGHNYSIDDTRTIEGHIANRVAETATETVEVLEPIIKPEEFLVEEEIQAVVAEKTAFDNNTMPPIEFTGQEAAAFLGDTFSYKGSEVNGYSNDIKDATKPKETAGMTKKPVDNEEVSVIEEEDMVQVTDKNGDAVVETEEDIMAGKVYDAERGFVDIEGAAAFAELKQPSFVRFHDVSKGGQAEDESLLKEFAEKYPEISVVMMPASKNMSLVNDLGISTFPANVITNGEDHTKVITGGPNHIRGLESMVSNMLEQLGLNSNLESYVAGREALENVAETVAESPFDLAGGENYDAVPEPAAEGPFHNPLTPMVEGSLATANEADVSEKPKADEAEKPQEGKIGIFRKLFSTGRIDPATREELGGPTEDRLAELGAVKESKPMPNPLKWLTSGRENTLSNAHTDPDGASEAAAKEIMAGAADTNQTEEKPRDEEVVVEKLNGENVDKPRGLAVMAGKAKDAVQGSAVYKAAVGDEENKILTPKQRIVSLLIVGGIIGLAAKTNQVDYGKLFGQSEPKPEPEQVDDMDAAKSGSEQAAEAKATKQIANPEVVAATNAKVAAEKLSKAEYTIDGTENITKDGKPIEFADYLKDMVKSVINKDMAKASAMRANLPDADEMSSKESTMVSKSFEEIGKVLSQAQEEVKAAGQQR